MRLDIVEVGRVIGAHGIRGEIKVISGGDYVPQPGSVIIVAGRELEVSAVRPHGNALLITVEGISDRTTAEAMKGRTVSIHAEDLPEKAEGEYYHAELVGLRVTTVTGLELGEVTAVMETGANDVFEINGPLGEVLIPFIPDVVKEIDLGAGTMLVDPLEGLLPEGADEGRKGQKASGSTGGEA